MAPHLREATTGDWSDIWPIVDEVVLGLMVASTAQGRGVGRALVEDALTWARAAGFRAMQFNAVAETNVAAVRLYDSVGFSIVGTVPEAFNHPERGLVGLHIMHLKLR